MKFTKISADTFKKLQLNAGVLLSSFDPDSASIVDTAILGATTGGVRFNAAPTFSDFGADIDNCPKNTKELKRVDDWTVSMSGTFITVDASVAARLVALADEADGKITPRTTLKIDDFADIWWVGDYSDVDGGFIAIHLMNALSTGGFSIQTGDKAKGQFAFEFTGHFSMDAQDTVPFEIYVSEAASDAAAANVEEEEEADA